MSIPSESVVRDVLSRNDRAQRLRAAVSTAWLTLQDKYPDRAWWRRKSTRAAVVWEEAINNAIGSFGTDGGVRPLRHYDTVSFIFDDQVLVRLKKADMELKTNNVQTVLSSLFHRHDADLFGYSGLQRIETAYVLNKFETDISWIGVVAREKKSHLFHFELNELAAPARGPILFPELPKTSPADIAKLRRVLPDRKRDEKGE